MEISSNSKPELKLYQNIEEVPTGISRRLKNKRNTKKSLNRLYINIGVSGAFMIGEIVGGVLSDSIAVITDAFHIFTDILGFLIIIVSLQLTRKQATYKMTYGFHRAEVIGTLLSIALIWGLTAWLVTEAVQRLITPQPVDGLVMLITACGGVLGNVIMGLVLIITDPDGTREANNEIQPENNESPEVGNNNNVDVPMKSEQKQKMSLNIRAAFIHVLGDGIQSLGVAIAGVIVYVRPEYRQADPVCTLMFCVVVLATTLPILGDCVKILMEASPGEIDIRDMISNIKEIEEVIDLHDLHIWSLSSGKISLSCHLISDSPSSALEKTTKVLKEKFNIGHVTIQIETGDNSAAFQCENDLH